jgi:hypothetical protein
VRFEAGGLGLQGLRTPISPPSIVTALLSAKACG